MTRRSLYPLSTWTIWVLALPLGAIALGFVLVALMESDRLLFDHPNLWWLGIAGPAAGFLFLYGVIRRRNALHRLTSARLAPLLAARVSPSRQATRASLSVLAILLIVAGVIGPRWGIYLEKQKVRGIDVVVALDVSRSMLAEDLEPNRIEHAKRRIREQLTERAIFEHRSRLALLAFAGSTSLKLPLTTDHLSFRSKLEQVHVGSAPRGGTDVAGAIRAATDLFAKSPEEATKIIMLFTDGEDHGQGAAEAARTAQAEHDIRVFTIGVGDPARTVGAQVPSGDGGGQKPLLYQGQIVFSKLDVTGLREIAEAGGGRYAPIQDLHIFVNAIAGMKKAELTTEERMRHKPRYQWFLTAALILLGLTTMISDLRPPDSSGPQRVWQQEAI